MKARKVYRTNKSGGPEFRRVPLVGWAADYRSWPWAARLGVFERMQDAIR